MEEGRGGVIQRCWCWGGGRVGLDGRPFVVALKQPTSGQASFLCLYLDKLFFSHEMFKII